MCQAPNTLDPTLPSLENANVFQTPYPPVYNAGFLLEMC